MKRFTQLIVLVAFIVSCGGQWGAFQCLAWANMIREYSQSVPLSRAVCMTFSGKFPCALCKAIADKKSSDQQKVLAEKYAKKFCLSWSTRPFIRFRGTLSLDHVEDEISFASRSDAPPTPPPRRI